MKNVDWDLYQCFLAVARSGGLTAARRQTGFSAATIARRMLALEQDLGRTLFERSQAGYLLTGEGQALFDQLHEMEAAARRIQAWQGEGQGQVTVRIMLGSWIARLVHQNIAAINPEPERIRLAFAVSETRAPMSYRESDIAMRAAKPTEVNLAARKISNVAYALYARRNASRDVKERGLAVREEEAISAYLQWPHRHWPERIAVTVNRPRSLLDLARAGGGSAVLPCFVGDLEPDLERVGDRIEGLEHEQWLVTNNEDRHRPEIRKVADRIAGLIGRYRDVLEGRRPSRSGS